jgi:hypothetical protein
MTLVEIRTLDFDKFLVPVGILDHLKARLGSVRVKLAHHEEPDKAEHRQQGEQVGPSHGEIAHLGTVA